MQKHVFAFMGRRIELWTHPEPDHIGRVIHATQRFYEPDVLMKCLEVYIPGTVIVDVGANIGNHTVFFGALLEASVFAFEPFPANFELLELNLAANGLEVRVKASCLALGASGGLASLVPGPRSNRGVTRVSFGGGDVPVAALDELGIEGPVGLVKIDVEGTETAVLAGAAGLLRRWLPDVVIEAPNPAAFRLIAGMLLPLGYVPEGRYAMTPTYLFRATDRIRRIEGLLSAV